MREGSQGLERSVLTYDHRAAACVFNEANDGAGYFSKIHGCVAYHNLIKRKPPIVCLRLD